MAKKFGLQPLGETCLVGSMAALSSLFNWWGETLTEEIHISGTLAQPLPCLISAGSGAESSEAPTSPMLQPVMMWIQPSAPLPVFVRWEHLQCFSPTLHLFWFFKLQDLQATDQHRLGQVCVEDVAQPIALCYCRMTATNVWKKLNQRL